MSSMGSMSSMKSSASSVDSSSIESTSSVESDESLKSQAPGKSRKSSMDTSREAVRAKIEGDRQRRITAITSETSQLRGIDGTNSVLTADAVLTRHDDLE